jgi:serine/threonine protein kinase
MTDLSAQLRIAADRGRRVPGNEAVQVVQAIMVGAVDRRTDVWTVGILMAEVVLGEHPLAPPSLDVPASIGQLDMPTPSLPTTRRSPTEALRRGYRGKLAPSWVMRQESSISRT